MGGRIGEAANAIVKRLDTRDKLEEVGEQWGPICTLRVASTTDSAAPQVENFDGVTDSLLSLFS